MHRLFFISIVTCNNIFVTHNIFRFIIVCFPIVGGVSRKFSSGLARRLLPFREG